VIIITGSNTGIGFTAAIEIARLGPKTLIMACRSQTKALAAIATIQKKLSISQ
jgi:NAD(P)-dependent dehydrogenase (short-subunit alcohol dehydrogenase family)